MNGIERSIVINIDKLGVRAKSKVVIDRILTVEGKLYLLYIAIVWLTLWF